MLEAGDVAVLCAIEKRTFESSASATMFEFINESVAEGSREPAPDKAGRQAIRKQVMRHLRSRQRHDRNARAVVVKEDPLKPAATRLDPSTIRSKADFMRYLRQTSPAPLPIQLPKQLGHIPVFMPNGQDLGETGAWYWVHRPSTAYGVSVDVNDAMLRSAWERLAWEMHWLLSRALSMRCSVGWS